jgi:TetR/AcrR family transcriptional repressor of nem operon
MDLFWLRGYVSVTVSELADAMGVQRSSFYNSFGTREAVFLEALRQYGGRSPDVVLDRLTPDEPVVPALVALLRTVCRVRARDRQARGCLIFNSIAEVDTSDRQVRRTLARMMARRTRVVERLLRRAVARGELPHLPDVASAAREYVTFLVGLNTLSRVVRSERALWATSVSFLRGFGIAVPGVSSSRQTTESGRAR